MDATHPQHNPVIGCGWIKRGEDYPIKSNTGRQRININGAIEIQTYSAEIRFDVTIDAASTIALFQQTEKANPQARRIVVICDNAGYYRSKAVQEYLQTSRIQLEFLPAYSPISTSSSASGSSSSARCSTTDTIPVIYEISV